MEKTVKSRPRQNAEIELPEAVPLALHVTKSPLLGDSSARYSAKKARELVGSVL